MSREMIAAHPFSSVIRPKFFYTPLVHPLNLVGILPCRVRTIRVHRPKIRPFETQHTLKVRLS